MKKLLLGLLAASTLVGEATLAGTFDQYGSYHGTINGVAVGFFGGVGVGLTDGATCNGQPVVILQTSNAQYKDMLATLISAQATGSNVRVYKLTGTLDSNGYCLIESVSLGDFPLW